MSTDRWVKRVLRATVVSNVSIAPLYYRLKLEFNDESAKALSWVVPGQFIEIELSRLSLPPFKAIPENLLDCAQRQIILRRPFSFSDITVYGDLRVCAEVLFCALGPGTLRMTTLSKGDELGIIGPLGNGFSVSKGKTLALLIAGGMGAPPLQHLAGYLRSNRPEMELAAFAGAKSVGDLPFIVKGSELEEFSRFGIETHIATDDGSAGFKGFVTEYVTDWFKKRCPPALDTIIYSCGPEAMLAAVAKLAKENNIDCQISMERMMACGIGICQSCAVEVKVAGQSCSEYKLCCKDGPVFESKDVVFE